MSFFPFLRMSSRVRGAKVMEPVRKWSCNRLWLGICLAIILVAGVSYPTHAHHSLSAQYDYDWPFKFDDAVLTRARFINPHVHLYFNVKNEKGEVVEWDITT